MDKNFYPNLSEIVTATLRNRTGQLAKNMQANNALLARLLSPWVPQPKGAVPLPDYIKLSAQGKAKIEGGKVYLLEDDDG